MSYAVQIFIAYSRKDSSLLDEFRVHLKPLERAGKAQIWYDGLIEPGAVWEADIKKHLHASDIILLLVSADAIASDYFYDKEVADALERHHNGSARVVPMIMRPCDWYATPLEKLQAIPKNGRPVTSWPDRDEAYADAAKSLRAMIANIEQLKQELAADALRLQQAADVERQHRAAEAQQRQQDEARRREEEIRQRREAEADAKRAEEERRRREAEAQQRRQDEEQRQKEEAERKALLARQAEYARHIAEARKCLRRRDWSHATAAAQAALALAPDDANALHLISEAEAGSRQPEPVRPPYLQWAAIAAGVLLAVFIIVKVAGGSGKESQKEATERAYREAWLKAEAENTLPAWNDFLTAYPNGDRYTDAQRQADALKTKLNELLNDAEVLLDIGDKAGACNHLRDALLIDPSDLDLQQQIKKAGCPPAQ
jgi:hypothetical protein